MKWGNSSLAAETRAVLSEFSREKDGPWDALAIAGRYPGCGCEQAEPTTDGHGPVLDDETLRLFVVSRFNFDLKDKKPKLTQAMFNNVFKKGASAYRLGKASKAELELSAKILYEEAVKGDAHHGGIIGVLDFQARNAKYNTANVAERLMCVLDTPFPQRNSHCDIVTSVPAPEDKTALKARLFNQVKANDFVRSENVTDCDLLQFQPAALAAA